MDTFTCISSFLASSQSDKDDDPEQLPVDEERYGVGSGGYAYCVIA